MIKILIMDVDGTLTDGSIYLDQSGNEVYKVFNVKDGLGIKKLLKSGICPVVMTGRSSSIVKMRCDELGIKYCFMGIDDKKQKVLALAQELKVGLDEIAYIGDDENDLDVMSIVGISFAPNDSVCKVLDCVDIILKSNGGHGALRECAEMLITGLV